MCSRNTIRESSHISFFCCGDPFCEEVRRLENTHRRLTGLLEWPAGFSLRLRDQRISPPRLSDQKISAFRPKLQTLYCLSSPTYFLFMAGYRNVHTSLFSSNLLILSAMWNSVILSTSNKLFSLSCETTLLMLSCDCIEYAEFIVASEAIYYITRSSSLLVFVFTVMKLWQFE